ncbi:MAG: GAF and ANTAR domain-containing protein [Acidimicrobiia bacterium]
MDGSIKMLADTFLQLVDNTVDDFDPIRVLTMLCGRCVDLLDISAAAVALVDPDSALQVVVGSSDQAVQLLQVQIDTDGACVDAFRSGHPVFHNDDNGSSPRLGRDADTARLQCVHAFPMRARDRTIGTLNLFSTQPQALWDIDITVAQTFADAAAIALLNDRAISALHQLTMQLQGALTSRIVIEQAKGTIAERAGVSMDEAYERLRSHARSHHNRLTTVAEAVVAHTLTADIGTAIGATRRPRLASQT